MISLECFDIFSPPSSPPMKSDKPLSFVSKPAIVCLSDSLLSTADISLVCSSAAFSFWVEASRRSWDSWALDETRSSIRRLWKRKEAGSAASFKKATSRTTKEEKHECGSTVQPGFYRDYVGWKKVFWRKKEENTALLKGHSCKY